MPRSRSASPIPKSGLRKAERKAVDDAESAGVVRAAKKAYKSAVAARREILEHHDAEAVTDLQSEEKAEKVVHSKAKTAKVRKAALAAERAAEKAEEAIEEASEASPKRVTGAKRKAKEALVDAVHEVARVHVGHSVKRKAARTKARAASRSPPASRIEGGEVAVKKEVPVHFKLWHAAKAAFFKGEKHGRVTKDTEAYHAIHKIFTGMKAAHGKLSGGGADATTDALGGGSVSGSDAE